MNVTKFFRMAAASLAVALGIASPAQAAVSVYFSAGNTCNPSANTDFFTPGGASRQLSLCMTTTLTTATCGHSIVLQAASVAESGKFVVVSPVALGPNYPDANSEFSPLPLAISNPPTVADFGGTVADSDPTSAVVLTPVAAAADQLLATFNIAAQGSATNNSYVISLSSTSVVAVDTDGKCGKDTVPTEVPIAASITLSRTNLAPSFTSAGVATFSTTTSSTFTITATGNPTPTITAGTLPSGITFNGAAGTGMATLTGQPLAGGPYIINLTATNGVNPAAQQAFSLTASGQSSQIITFVGPNNQTFSSTLIPVTAMASSGLPITFSSQTPFVCTVAGGNVTMLTTGTCTILASQSGNASYLQANPVPQSFNILPSSPGAPTIGTATVGNARLTISFTPPSSTGGSPITSYTATCGGISASGNSSPIAVTGLANDTINYSCTVSATNQYGTGPSSGVVMGMPTAAAGISLVAVHSRKTHGTAGTFDLVLDTSIATLGGNVSVEPRFQLTGHKIVFQFNNTVTSVTSATTLDSSAVAGIGSPVLSFTGTDNEVTVTLTGAVLDNKRLTVQLNGVNGTLNPLVHVGFLIGDVTNNRIVSGTDILQVKGRSVTPTNSTNFMYDVNASGSITGSDILQVKGRSVSTLNP